MEVEFQCTKTDYLRFAWLNFKKAMRRQIVLLMIGPLIIGFMASGWPFDGTRFICGFVFTVLLLWGCFYFLPYWRGRQKLKAAINHEPKYLQHRKIRITEEGIKGTGEVEFLQWSAIAAVETDEEFTWFSYANKKISIIPNKAFQSESAKLNFISTLRHNIQKAQGMAHDKTPHAAKACDSLKKQKPLYILGLICLVPLFGVVAGVVFIIIGLVKYKDKWFTLMGLAGIGVSILMFMAASAGFDLFKNKLAVGSDGLFQKVAQTELTALVKDVEFYKLQNGRYPDSLQQLSKDNDEALFIDPTQTRQKNHFFYYARQGSQYELFSRGRDGLPHTKDDILPKIAQKTDGKIGLSTYTIISDTAGKK